MRLTHLNVTKIASEICNTLKNIDNIHVLKEYISLHQFTDGSHKLNIRGR